MKHSHIYSKYCAWQCSFHLIIKLHYDGILYKYFHPNYGLLEAIDLLEIVFEFEVVSLIAVKPPENKT